MFQDISPSLFAVFFRIKRQQMTKKTGFNTSRLYHVFLKTYLFDSASKFQK